MAKKNLAQHNLSVLIRFVDASDERNYLHRIQVAEHQHIEHQTSENTRRWCMAGLWSLAMVGFIYAGLTKDSILPRELVTIAITAAGGAKALKLCEERGNNKKD
jgi:hypothetical protein